MLAATLRLLDNEPNHGYARALRAIGRDLAEFHSDWLEIELVESNYRAHFHVRTPRLVPIEKRGLKHLLTKSSEPIKSSAMITPDTRTYTEGDIAHMYSSGRVSRKASNRDPDIYNLSESLRTIGGLIESRKGKLHRIKKRDNLFTFEYIDESGEIHTEEVSNQRLYRVQQEFSSSRDRTNKDTWGYRPM